MDEHLGAQYAVQIAVHTLKERCKNMQQRISALEEENINLRTSCKQKGETSSVTDLEIFKEQITELLHHKEQLQEKVKLISSENQGLWKKLGKLVLVNKSLGEQLNKITQTVNENRAGPLQIQNTLIRSKTFTQDEPMTKFLQKNLELNEKISMELENVSLKLTDSFSKQKLDLEKFSNDLFELRSIEVVGEHLGFGYIDNIQDDLCEEFQHVMEDLKLIKTGILEHKDVLKKNLKNLHYLCKEGAARCKTCDSRKNYYIDKSSSTSDLPGRGVDKFTEVPKSETFQSGEVIRSDIEKMCPICSRLFKQDTPFPQFQEHVESHFRHEIDSFEVI